MFGQILTLFSFIICGLLLGKSGKLKSSDASILSALEVYIFLPCMNFLTFCERFTLSYLLKKGSLLLYSVICIIIFHLLGTLFSKLFKNDDYEKEVFRYSTVITNYGYMGYALVASYFGGDALLDFAFFSIPFSFYIYIYAFPKLTGAKGGIKKILNPPLIAMLVGSLFGILGIDVCETVNRILSAGYDCMAPFSMLLTGIAISEFNIIEILKNVKVYIITLVRLIIMPATAIITCVFLPREVSLMIIIYCALPSGLNTVIFPKFAGKDCRLGAGLALFSNLAACATVPFWLMTATRILGGH